METLGFSAALATSVLWAWSSVRFQPAIQAHGALLCSVAKVLLAGMLFWVFLGILALFTAVKVTGLEGTLLLVVSGIVGMAIGDYAFFASMRQFGVRRASLVHSTNPLFLLGFAWLDSREHLTVFEVVGILLMVCGVLDVIRSQGRIVPVRREQLRAGVAWGLLSALGQAVGIVLARGPLGECHFGYGAAVRLTGAAAGLWVLAALLGRHRRLTEGLVRRELWRDVVAPTFFGTTVGVGLMMVALTYGKTAVAGALLSLTPLFILPLSARLLAEGVPVRVVVGAGMAVVGVIIVSL